VQVWRQAVMECARIVIEFLHFPEFAFICHAQCRHTTGMPHVRHCLLIPCRAFFARSDGALLRQPAPFHDMRVDKVQSAGTPVRDVFATTREVSHAPQAFQRVACASSFISPLTPGGYDATAALRSAGRHAEMRHASNDTRQPT